MKRFIGTLWALILVFAASQTVAAQDAEDSSDDAATIDAAEAAFVNLEYETAHQVAQRALEAGGHDPQQTKRLYELIGLSASFLQEDTEAYDAYLRMMALDPDADMDRSLPPSLRTPFLRARGWWAAQNQALEVDVRIGDPGRPSHLQLVLELQDPLQMVETVHLRTRAEGSDEFMVREFQSVERRLISSQALQTENDAEVERFDYILEVRDPHGNVLIRQGTAIEPAHVENPRYRPPQPIGSVQPSGPQAWEEWWFWTIIGVAVAGAGAAVGLYFGLPPQLNGQSQVTFGF